MKRNIALVLAFLLLLSACGKVTELEAEPPLTVISAPEIIETLSPTPESAADITPPLPETLEPEPTAIADEIEPKLLRYSVTGQVRDDMPEFTVVVVGEDRSRLETWHFVYPLILYAKDDNGAVMFTMDFAKYEAIIYDEMSDTFGLHIVDVNFDGFRDVIVLSNFSGTYANSWYDCWLWNAETQGFEYAKSFNMCNPTLDRDNKRIYSHGGIGASESLWEMYEYVDGEFIVVNSLHFQDLYEESEYSINADDYPPFPGRRWIEKALIENEWIVVRDISIPTIEANDSLENEIAAEYAAQDGFWRLHDERWYKGGGHHADKWLED